MKRLLSTAVVIAALSSPVLAADTMPSTGAEAGSGDAVKVTPGKGGPTEAVTSQTPTVKGGETKPEASSPATSNVDKATPPMKPTDPK